LYGSWLFTPDERVFLTITEGQLDALSVSEAFDRKYPVVSLPNGVKSAAKVIQQNMAYIKGFKYVVLAFDSDEPGQQAVKECLALFTPGKLRIAKWEQKDANDHLKLGETSAIRNIIYNAVQYIPEPILTGNDWLEGLVGYERKTRPWPWAAANTTIAPLSIPGIYSIAALPGVGKTMVVADIMKDAIERTGKVGVISLEETSQNLLLKLTDMIKGTRLSNISNRKLTNEEIEMCREVTEKVVTYDHKTYGYGLDTILENLPYIAQSLNCDTIIFDNLSYSATDENDDERRAIDKAMIKLKDSSTKYNYILINVTHLNQDGADFKDSTIRGSRGIIMYSDYVIHLGRDVEAEDAAVRNTLTFHVKKDRMRGVDTGKSFDLHYDPVNRCFKDKYKVEENITYNSGI
jgi:twinkle protein